MTDYVNTIPAADEPSMPGDEEMEHRIRRLIRWNAAVMVSRANHRFDGIGGHLATYASAATLYEVGFNHFFHGKADGGFGDQVFFQGHASPGIYARAFLEGRLDEGDLDRFRREVGGGGLPSYPHPRRMTSIFSSLLSRPCSSPTCHLRSSGCWLSRTNSPSAAFTSSLPPSSIAGTTTNA